MSASATISFEVTVDDLRWRQFPAAEFENAVEYAKSAYEETGMRVEVIRMEWLGNHCLSEKTVYIKSVWEVAKIQESDHSDHPSL